MRLLACPSCRAQYDVTHLRRPSFPCRCGARIENRPHDAVDAEIKRCASCGGSVADGVAACGYCGSTIERDARRRSMVCPECHARNVGTAHFCSSCGVAFRPISIDGERAALPCPECREVEMLPTAIGGVPADECGHCHGLWVAGARFDELVERALEGAKRRYSVGVDGGREPAPVALTSVRSKIRYRRCPQCGEFMQRKNFAGSSGVIVDWCGDHGTWLDADELELISAFVLRGGMVETGTRTANADLDGVFERMRWDAGGGGAFDGGGLSTVLGKAGRRARGGWGMWTDLLRHLLDW